MGRVGWWVSAVVAIGVAVGVAMCAIALDHNPQGEFRDPATGQIDWPYLIVLGASWAAAVAAALAALVSIVGLAWRRGGLLFRPSK